MGPVKEVEGNYDVTLSWVDEAISEEACRVLDELLSPGHSLGDRINARKSALVVPIERLRPELLKMLDCLLISL
jgi:hypothetical protein